MDLVTELKKVPELEGLEQGEIEKIASLLKLVDTTNHEQILIKEEEPQARVFVVLSGELNRSKHGVHIDSVTPTRFSGLLHAFRHEQTFATLTAPKGSVVYEMDAEAFRQIISSNPCIAIHLLEKLSLRLRTESKWQRSQREEKKSTLKIVFFDSKEYDVRSFEALLPALNAQAPPGKELELSFHKQRLTSETASAAMNASAVCVFVNDQVTPDVINQLTKFGVKLIALRCAGYDGVDLKQALGYGIPVVRVPGYSPEAVAEHAAALMLGLGRSLHRAYQRTREGNFSLEGLTGMDIFGKTVGIVGTGRIGKCFANIAKGFGCTLKVYDVYQDKAWAESIGAEYVSFDDLAAAADIISIHCPLFPSTHHLINKEAIDKMKRGVMILNTSRGAIIDTEALLEGLDSGKIGAAGLDVYENERPYFFQDCSNSVINDHTLTRLSNMNNVILTGHQAYLTTGALSQIASITFQNIIQFFWEEGQEPLPNQVLDEWKKLNAEKKD